MGRFFNQKLITLKKIPHITTRKNNPVEEMRVEFNKIMEGTILPQETPHKPLTARQIRERNG